MGNNEALLRQLNELVESYEELEDLEDLHEFIHAVLYNDIKTKDGLDMSMDNQLSEAWRDKTFTHELAKEYEKYLQAQQHE